VKGTLACQHHQKDWKNYTQKHRQQTAPGSCRIFHQREVHPWQQPAWINSQPHDDEPAEPAEEAPKKKNFSASQFYCVETICAPCGVVIAWAKFAKSESPTNILAFLEIIFPTEESRPDYICINKSCSVLHTAIANGSWATTWAGTTRFIVDSYHYINH
jgi:hypothetical protein